MRIYARERLLADSTVLHNKTRRAVDGGDLKLNGDTLTFLVNGKEVASLHGVDPKEFRKYRKFSSYVPADGTKATDYQGVSVRKTTRGSFVNSFDVTFPYGNIGLVKFTLSA